MRHLVVNPIIGGLVVIIIAGLWMHDGSGRFGRSASYQSGCHFSAASGSLSPMIVGAMIRNGVHC